MEIFGEPESGDYAETYRLLNRAGVIPPIGVRSGFYGTVRLVNAIKFGSDAFQRSGLGGDPAAIGPWCWVLEATPQDGEPRALAADEPCTGLLLKLAILAA